MGKREAPDHNQEVEGSTVLGEKAHGSKDQPGLSMVIPTSVGCHKDERKDYISSLLECVRPSAKNKVK